MKSKAKGSKKGKGSKSHKGLVEKSKQYEADQQSDDEMPEEVSNTAMKNSLEVLNKEVAALKKRLRQEEKAKRRSKEEMFIAQKKSKLNTEDGQGLNADNDAERTVTMDAAPLNTITPINEELAEEGSRRSKQTKKVYSAFNVTVEPLTKTDSTRASAALDFKSRRLANVPRESVKTAVISYKRKLQARKI